MKRVLLFLVVFIFSIQVFSQNTIIVGDTTSTQTSQYYPACHYYEDSYTQMLYKSDELQAGTITSISFYCTQGNWSNGTVKIYMKEVSDNTLTTYSSAEGFVEVYTGLDQNAVGWVNFTLTNPFNYSGEDNLLICFIRDGTSWYGGALSYKINTEPNSVLSTFNDAQSYTINSVLNPQWGYRDERPIIKIEYGELGDFCYPPANVQVLPQTISEDQAVVNWTYSDESSTTFALAYKSESAQQWSLLSDTITTNSYTLTGLDSYTRYQVKVWTICSGTNSSEVVKDFMTLPTEDNFITIPYEQNFDDLSMLSHWYFDNPNVNKWYIGSVVNNPLEEDITEGNGLYISNTNGTTNSYSTLTTSEANAYVLINVEEGSYYGVSFDYKSIGENPYDYLMVLLSSLDETQTNIELYQGFSTNNQWERITIPFPNNLQEGAYKLMFSWRNDNAGGTNPPAAIDNVNIYSTSCASVNEFAITMEDDSESVLMNISVIDSLNEDVEYLVEYRYVGDSLWNTIQSASPIEIVGLSYASNLEFQVTAYCGDGNVSFVSDLQTVYTLCNPISEMPYLENFSSFTSISDNLRGNQEAPNCWFNVGSQGNYHWSWSSSGGINNSSALFFSGTSYTTNATFSEWIISPVFELTGNQRLNFQYKITNTSVNMPKIDVYVLDSSMNYSSMTDTSNFVFLASFNTANSNIDEWKMAEVLLNSYMGNVRIALVIREASQSFYVDNFSITTQPTCPNVYDFEIREASQSVLVTYNIGNITESGVLLAYSPITENTTFNPETATTITISANEELPFLVGGLTTGTTYAFAVKQNCGGEWTNTITKTIPFAYTLPITMDFNTTATTPTMTFSGEVNTWVIGNAENNSLDTLLGNALYVSKDNGATSTYDKNNSAESFASFPISFTPEVEFELSFDWKCLGEGEFDNISVYLIPYGDTINEVYNIISYNGNSYLSGGADWNTYTKILSSEYFGVYNLVFKWKNDHMLGNQPGGVIDNIRLISHACISDIDFNLSFLEAENNTSPSIIVNVTDELNVGLTYTIKYKSLFSTEYTEIVNLTSSNFPYTITEGIEHQMIYDFQIGVVCSQSETLYTPLQTITTPCQTLESPWFEDFESNVLLSPSCWNKYSGAFSQNGTITTSQLTATSHGWVIVNDNIDSLSQTSDFLALNTSHNTMYYWAMSPIIDLSDDTSVKQIAFDLGVKGENIFQQTTSDNKFAVIVSLDGGLTWDIANGLIFSDNDLDTNHNFSNLNNQITRYAYKLVDENNQALSGKVRFAFYGETTAYDGNYTIFVDNVSLEQWSECQVPYGISFSAITSNSAKVSFNTWGLANSWEYVIAPGVETSVIDTVTPILVSSSSPIELSGLLPTTDYVIGIRSVCGTANSPWTIAFFTTKEAGASIPYLTSFDDLEDANTWHITNNLTNNIWNIGTATSSDTGSAAYISIDNGLTYSAQSSSNITYAYMWKDFSFGETDELFELSFDWKIRGREVDNEIQNGLAVYLTTYDTPPTDTFPLEEERITLLYASDNWQNEKVFLDNIRGDKRLVFLTWGYTNSEDTIVPAAIDNVSLYTTVCTPPTSVPEVAEIIGNNAIIMWEDADTTHTQWNVYYKTLAANTYTSISVTGPSVELNNLLPTTTYTLYVTADCGETESAHSGKITFRTECPLIQLPYEEFFDEDVARNTCWTTAKGLLSDNVTFVDNQQYWFQSTDSVADNSTPKMKINIYGTDVRQHWLITPQIDLGNGAETNILSLDVALKAFSSAENAPQPAPDDVFAIVVSIDGGLTWSSEYALVYTDEDEDVEHNFSDFTDTSFTRITYLLQDSYGNPLSGLVKIGFYGESTIYNGDNNLYIDNLYVGPIIEEILPCDAPTELTVTNITSSTAEISWVGSADNYEIKLNAGEIETLSSTNKILTDLTPLTQYMVEVRAVCENENSAWVAISFLTHSEQDNEVVEGQVSTLSATNVGNTSATLNGALVNAGESENFTVGFALSTTADFTLETADVQNITATLNGNTFSQAITDLTEGQTYFYRAYITNEAGTAYGEVETFTLSGLADVMANTLTATIYPNPATSQATLEINGLNQDAKIVISDLQGRILSQDQISAGENRYTINVSEMASGVYYIRIVTDSVVSTQKLIVE